MEPGACDIYVSLPATGYLPARYFQYLPVLSRVTRRPRGLPGLQLQH